MTTRAQWERMVQCRQEIQRAVGLVDPVGDYLALLGRDRDRRIARERGAALQRARDAQRCREAAHEAA